MQLNAQLTGKSLLSCIILLLFCNVQLLYAQQSSTTTTTKKEKTVTKSASGTFSAKSPTVNVDLGLNAFSDVLPFDVPFQIVGTGGTNSKITIDQITSIECYYSTKKDRTEFPDQAEVNRFINDKKNKYHYTQWINRGADTQYVLRVGELAPNKEFSFFFRFKRKLSTDERARLTSFVTTIIKPEIIKKATGKSIAFNVAETKVIVDNIINLITKNLAANQLSVDFGTLDYAHYKAMAKSIENVGFSFEVSNDEMESMNNNLAVLKNDELALQSFLANYKINGPADADKDNNVAVLTNVLQLYPGIYDYPKESNALDPDLIKGYNEQIAKLLAELAKVKLPPTSAFQKTKDEIVDVSSSDLSKNFNEYVVSLKNSSIVTSDQVNSFVEAVAVSLYNEAFVTGSSVNGDFVTRSNTYISADLGVAVIPSMSKLVPYIGTNIYFRPVNKNKPLKIGEDGDFFRRFSVMVGLTYTTLAKTGYRADLLGSNFSLITGAGLRVADFIRINGGVVWYSKINPNPLNTNQSIKGSGFVSLSFDIDVKTIFNKLFLPADITAYQP